MRLFGHPDSGHCLKVKFFLDWLEVDYQYEYLDIFSDKNTRTQEFNKSSKFSEVPTIIDENKSFIQSNAILVYLADKFKIFANADERQKCLEWLFWEANKIGLCLPQLRADKKLSKKYPEFKLTKEAFNWLLARYNHDINILEQELSDNRSFILGEKITPADFSLSAYLMYADETKLDVPENVNTWLNRLRKQKGWQDPYISLRQLN